MTNKHDNDGQEGDVAQAGLQGCIEAAVRGPHVREGGDGEGGRKDQGGGDDEQIFAWRVPQDERCESRSEDSDSRHDDRSEERVDGGSWLLEDVGHVEDHGGDPRPLSQ